MRDTVENSGYRAQPLMLIYHINLGFLLVSPYLRIVGPVKRTVRYDEETNRPEVLPRWCGFTSPQNETCRRLFLHECAADASGQTFFAVVNESLAPAGICGLEVRCSAELMPYQTHFKVWEAGIHICCLELGTVCVHRRGPLRRDNKVPLLRPDERREYSLSFRVLTGNHDIEALQTESDRLTAAKEPRG